MALRSSYLDWFWKDEAAATFDRAPVHHAHASDELVHHHPPSKGHHGPHHPNHESIVIPTPYQHKHKEHPRPQHESTKPHRNTKHDTHKRKQTVASHDADTFELVKAKKMKFDDEEVDFINKVVEAVKDDPATMAYYVSRFALANHTYDEKRTPITLQETYPDIPESEWDDWVTPPENFHQRAHSDYGFNELFFPYLSHGSIRRMKMDKYSHICAAPYTIGFEMANIISDVMKTIDPHLSKSGGIKIADCTAGVGCQTIPFAIAFNDVVAIELHRERAGMLVNNLNQGLRDLKRDPSRVQCFWGDCCDREKIPDLDECHVKYYSPTWDRHGDFKKEDDIVISIGGIELSEVVRRDFSRSHNTKLVACSVPANYDVKSFKRSLGCRYKVVVGHVTKVKKMTERSTKTKNKGGDKGTAKAKKHNVRKMFGTNMAGYDTKQVMAYDERDIHPVDDDHDAQDIEYSDNEFDDGNHDDDIDQTDGESSYDQDPDERSEQDVDDDSERYSVVDDSVFDDGEDSQEQQGNADGHTNRNNGGGGGGNGGGNQGRAEIPRSAQMRAVDEELEKFEQDMILLVMADFSGDLKFDKRNHLEVYGKFVNVQDDEILRMYNNADNISFHCLMQGGALNSEFSPVWMQNISNHKMMDVRGYVQNQTEMFSTQFSDLSVEQRREIKDQFVQNELERFQNSKLLENKPLLSGREIDAFVHRVGREFIDRQNRHVMEVVKEICDEIKQKDWVRQDQTLLALVTSILNHRGGYLQDLHWTFCSTYCQPGQPLNEMAMNLVTKYLYTSQQEVENEHGVLVQNNLFPTDVQAFVDRLRQSVNILRQVAVPQLQMWLEQHDDSDPAHEFVWKQNQKCIQLAAQLTDLINKIDETDNDGQLVSFGHLYALAETNGNLLAEYQKFGGYITMWETLHSRFEQQLRTAVTESRPTIVQNLLSLYTDMFNGYTDKNQRLNFKKLLNDLRGYLPAENTKHEGNTETTATEHENSHNDSNDGGNAVWRGRKKIQRENALQESRNSNSLVVQTAMRNQAQRYETKSNERYVTSRVSLDGEKIFFITSGGARMKTDAATKLTKNHTLYCHNIENNRVNKIDIPAVHKAFVVNKGHRNEVLVAMGHSSVTFVGWTDGGGDLQAKTTCLYDLHTFMKDKKGFTVEDRSNKKKLIDIAVAKNKEHYCLIVCEEINGVNIVSLYQDLQNLFKEGNSERSRVTVAKRLKYYHNIVSITSNVKMGSVHLVVKEDGNEISVGDKKIELQDEPITDQLIALRLLYQWKQVLKAKGDTGDLVQILTFIAKTTADFNKTKKYITQFERREKSLCDVIDDLFKQFEQETRFHEGATKLTNNHFIFIKAEWDRLPRYIQRYCYYESLLRADTQDSCYMLARIDFDYNVGDSAWKVINPYHVGQRMFTEPRIYAITPTTLQIEVDFEKPCIPVQRLRDMDQVVQEIESEIHERLKGLEIDSITPEAIVGGASVREKLKEGAIVQGMACKHFLLTTGRLGSNKFESMGEREYSRVSSMQSRFIPSTLDVKVHEDNVRETSVTDMIKMAMDILLGVPTKPPKEYVRAKPPTYRSSNIPVLAVNPSSTAQQSCVLKELDPGGIFHMAPGHRQCWSSDFKVRLCRMQQRLSTNGKIERFGRYGLVLFEGENFQQRFVLLPLYGREVADYMFTKKGLYIIEIGGEKGPRPEKADVMNNTIEELRIPSTLMNPVLDDSKVYFEKEGIVYVQGYDHRLACNVQKFGEYGVMMRKYDMISDEMIEKINFASKNIYSRRMWDCVVKKGEKPGIPAYVMHPVPFRVDSSCAVNGKMLVVHTKDNICKQISLTEEDNIEDTHLVQHDTSLQMMLRLDGSVMNWMSGSFDGRLMCSSRNGRFACWYKPKMSSGREPTYLILEMATGELKMAFGAPFVLPKNGSPTAGPTEIPVLCSAVADDGNVLALLHQGNHLIILESGIQVDPTRHDIGDMATNQAYQCMTFANEGEVCNMEWVHREEMLLVVTFESGHVFEMSFPARGNMNMIEAFYLRPTALIPHEFSNPQSLLQYVDVSLAELAEGLVLNFEAGLESLFDPYVDNNMAFEIQSEIFETNIRIERIMQKCLVQVAKLELDQKHNDMPIQKAVLRVCEYVSTMIRDKHLEFWETGVCGETIVNLMDYVTRRVDLHLTKDEVEIGILKYERAVLHNRIIVLKNELSASEGVDKQSINRELKLKTKEIEENDKKMKMLEAPDNAKQTMLNVLQLLCHKLSTELELCYDKLVRGKKPVLFSLLEHINRLTKDVHIKRDQILLNSEQTLVEMLRRMGGSVDQLYAKYSEGRKNFDYLIENISRKYDQKIKGGYKRFNEIFEYTILTTNGFFNTKRKEAAKSFPTQTSKKKEELRREKEREENFFADSRFLDYLISSAKSIEEKTVYLKKLQERGALKEKYMDKSMNVLFAKHILDTIKEIDDGLEQLTLDGESNDWTMQTSASIHLRLKPRILRRSGLDGGLNVKAKRLNPNKVNTDSHNWTSVYGRMHDTGAGSSLCSVSQENGRYNFLATDRGSLVLYDSVERESFDITQSVCGVATSSVTCMALRNGIMVVGTKEDCVLVYDLYADLLIRTIKFPRQTQFNSLIISNNLQDLYVHYGDHGQMCAFKNFSDFDNQYTSQENQESLVTNFDFFMENMERALLEILSYVKYVDVSSDTIETRVKKRFKFYKKSMEYGMEVIMKQVSKGVSRHNKDEFLKRLTLLLDLVREWMNRIVGGSGDESIDESSLTEEEKHASATARAEHKMLRSEVKSWFMNYYLQMVQARDNIRDIMTRLQIYKDRIALYEQYEQEIPIVES